MSKNQIRISWVAQILAAVILLQTLFFKLSEAPESVYIFESVGMEPVGRIGSAIVEGIAGVLLLVPAFAWAGAVIALGVISGAIFFHLTSLGIVVMDDGGTLFILALIVFGASLAVLALRKSQWLPLVMRFALKMKLRKIS